MQKYFNEKEGDGGATCLPVDSKTTGYNTKETHTLHSKQAQDPFSLADAV